MLARRSSATGGWAPADLAFTFREAAQNVAENCWHAVERHFRDGHAEVWWAAELTLAGHGPGKRGRAVCATTDRNTLPEISTWYLTTNLAREQVSLAEIVRFYGLRNWVEQSYKQMKDELGWADFMVRKDRAIRRHWELVCCAFVFCWWHADCRSRVSDATHHPVSVAPSSKWRKKIDSVIATPCWTRSLRAVRAWLAPAYWLARCWSAFSNTPPPPELATLIEAVAGGQGINLYLRI